MESSRKALEICIKEAKELLESTKEYCSGGNREALEDMIGQAELALEGQKVSFTRNRAFYQPREEEEIHFALNRYTMAPTYFDKEVYYHYGLEEAVKWYKSAELSKADWPALKEKAGILLEQSKELLRSAEYGEAAGCYKGSCGKALQESVAKTGGCIEKEDREGLKKEVIRLADALRDMRFSRVLRTDVDKESSLLMTGDELRALKKSILHNESRKQQVEELEKTAGKYTLENLQELYRWCCSEDDYDSMNKEHFLWSYTDKIVNFTAPKEACYGQLSFTLPCEENEEDGLGHVWIDDIEIMSASGKELFVRNPGLEEGERAPEFWQETVRKGNPVLLWEDRYPYCGNDKKSIYLCNPTRKDEGSWCNREKIPLEGGTGYTLTFYAKLDGKLKKGLRAAVTFLNEEGEEVGEFHYYFNRKSYLKTGSFNLIMQCDAILYALKEETDYARKAKYGILCFLQDFCQGAEHWMVTNLRPDGSDAYGAVQGGRNLSVIACTYSLIKDAPVWSKEEKEEFYALIEYMLRYMLDLRDRTELSAGQAQHGCSNWQTDMCIGTALMMMVMEDFPRRKSWLYSAHAVLRAQLKYNVNPDGSWPESIRYHHAALEHFAGYARAVLLNMGEDWFRETPLGEMFTYSLNLQTPGYLYYGNRIGTPPFGDHVLDDGREFAIYGIYLKQIESIDKNAADKMYATWCLAGKPVKALWGESIILENLLTAGEDYRTEEDFHFHLESTAEFKNAGIYVFRKQFGEEKQSYFAVMSSPEIVKHGHYDQGSFIIYKNSIPIVMDSGIEGYFDSSTEWHLSSYSHACMLFAQEGDLPVKQEKSINLSAGTFSRERGWLDVPRTSNVLEVSVGGQIEYIKIQIGHPEGRGKHIREIYWVKEADLYIIRDYVKDYEGRLLFNLPVASSSSRIEGKHILSEGYYGIELETLFLSPTVDIWKDRGRTAPFLPVKEKVQLLEYIRAEAEAKDGFLVLLHPREKEEKLKIVPYGEGCIRITCTNGPEIQLECKGSAGIEAEIL